VWNIREDKGLIGWSLVRVITRFLKGRIKVLLIGCAEGEVMIRRVLKLMREVIM
jgi:hypothetical protein